MIVMNDDTTSAMVVYGDNLLSYDMNGSWRKAGEYIIIASCKTDHNTVEHKSYDVRLNNRA